MPLFRLILCCLVLSSPVRADDSWDPSLTRGTLENGLDYIVHAQDGGGFNIRVIVHAGSVDEAGSSGVAHAMEHMAFQTTRAHPDTIHAFLRQIGWQTGLQVNAVTNETVTQYMIRTRPNDALDLAQSLDLMADMTLGAVLEDADWQKERGVVLAEMAGGDSLPARLSRQKKDLLRSGSRYVARPTIGTEQSVREMSIDDLRIFRDSFYRASNMTLIVSGGVDAEAATAAIRNSFGTAPGLPQPDRSYLVLPLDQTLTVGLAQDNQGSTSQVTYAFRVPMPPRGTSEGRKAYLEKYLLARLLQDALADAAPRHQPVIDSLTTVAQEPTEERLILAFNARGRDHDAALEILLDTVDRLNRQGIDPAAFERELARAQQVNRRNIDAATNRTYAEWEDRITSAVMTSQPLQDAAQKSAELEPALQQITVEDLNRRLRVWLAAPDRVLIYQVPGGVTRVLPKVEDVLARVRTLADRETLPALPPAAATEPSRPAPELPSVDLAQGRILSERRDGDVMEWALSNGDRMVWLDKPAADGRIYLSAQSTVGFQNDRFGPIQSQAAVQLYTQSGFAFWTQDEYDRWLADRDAKWQWTLQDGSMNVGLSAFPDALPEAFREYALMLTQAEVRSEAMAAIPKPPEPDAWQLMRYSPPAQEPEATAEQMTQTARTLLLQPVTWFAVGTPPDDATKTAIARHLGGIERTSPIGSAPLRQLAGRGDRQTDEARHPQVRMAYFAPMDWTPEGAFLVSALAPLAREALKTELRHRLGAVYSIRFELTLDPDTDRIAGTLSFDAPPERAPQLAEAAKAVLADMPRIVSQADIDRLRADVTFAEQTRAEDPNTWLRRLALSYRRYGNAGYLNRMDGLADRIDTRIMTRHAQTAFDTTNLLSLVVR